MDHLREVVLSARKGNRLKTKPADKELLISRTIKAQHIFLIYEFENERKIKLIAKNSNSICLPLFSWFLWFVSWAHSRGKYSYADVEFPFFNSSRN